VVGERDDGDDAFSFDWGSTPESRRWDALVARAHRAIERDDADELRRLHAEEADWRGGDVFHDAVRRGSINCVRFLLGLLSWANEPDECGGTPLMSAAQGDLSLVKVLVEAGADPNALAEDFVPDIDEDCRYQSALFWAALAGRQDVVEYLAPLTNPDLRRRVPDLIRRRREWETRGRDADSFGEGG
jgi:ankyrin repeat protein